MGVVTPDSSVIELAKDHDIVILRTQFAHAYCACGFLYSNGLRGGCEKNEWKHNLKYIVPGDDFTRAGEASKVKRKLKQLGWPDVIRKVAIAMYERRTNMAHAGGGEADVEILPDKNDAY